MANVPETPSFDAGIYQIETTDPVLGRVNGIANAQAKGLANRTAFLKQQIDQLNSGQFAPSWIASRTYVQGDLQKLDAKQSVRAATVANITLSGAQTIDSGADGWRPGAGKIRTPPPKMASTWWPPKAGPAPSMRIMAPS